MNVELRRRIHAFRNALVLAADTRSHDCFQMGRWRVELNNFPHGCCDLASNFLAQYLKDGDPALQPVIVHMQTTENFRQAEQSTIHSHVVVELNGWYIDLTLNQFAEYEGRVMIEDKTGTVGTLRRKIRSHEGVVTERGIQLDSAREDGHELYAWLKGVADCLMSASAGKDENPCSPAALVSTESLPENRDSKKKPPKMTHEGIISECYSPRLARLRETKTMWISESGMRFRKSTGAAVGSGVWSSHRLDLKSIKELQLSE
ncbi:hypothetical protein AAGW04_18190 [Pectobacterium aroidearum]|uniref:hypothetical protein n=1 Tax=Pectobacterium aroidearum TaxID=1201031 RepID=UPI0031588266